MKNSNKEIYRKKLDQYIGILYGGVLENTIGYPQEKYETDANYLNRIKNIELEIIKKELKYNFNIYNHIRQYIKKEKIFQDFSTYIYNKLYEPYLHDILYNHSAYVHKLIAKAINNYHHPHN